MPKTTKNIQLFFIVDKLFLLQHILKSPTPNRHFQKIRYLVWKKNKTLYWLLAQNIEPIIFQGDIWSQILSIPTTILEEIFYSSSFEKIFQETLNYQKWIQKEWEKNYKKSFGIVKKIVRLPNLNHKKKIKVYLSHPLIPKGRCYPEDNVICWAHKEDWNYYNIVYLWHEILHILTYDLNCNEQIMHALIELAIDNELRIQLWKKGEYFKINNSAIGHKNLQSLEKIILPFWQKYLKDKKLNLYKLAKKLEKELGENKFSPPTPFAHWNEWH
jgi:hypothetical protein